MIAKGNLHGEGGKLAVYMTTGKEGERAELVELRGFATDDIRTAFLDIEVQAYGTRCQKPFFHAYTRLPAGDELTREQWLQVADREEKRLGFAGQPRAVAFHHQPDGTTHMHVAWSRIDAEEGRAIDPGLYKNKLKELCRSLENQFGLTQVRNERAVEDTTRAAGRNEFEQARRLGTDLKAIRATIRDCWEHSDNGKSFGAALEASGLILARGDRRDYVVIDPAGGDHALAKRITGATAAETRTRLADIDPAQLPSVAEGKAQQHGRQAERENQRARDVAAAEAMRQAQQAAKGRADDTRAQPAKEDARPLGRMAGDIRSAWTLTPDTPDGGKLIEALAARGIALAEVSPAEARQSERMAAFANAVGNSPILREGEIVAVNEHGDIHRFNQRSTGDDRATIEGRLAGVDRASLLNVADTAEVMQEAARAAWAAERQGEREKAQPATSVETTIAAALAHTMTGHDFAAALDKAGLTIARATDADVLAIKALREAEDINRAIGAEHRPPFLADLRAGDFAAVTRTGDVFRLNPHRLDFEEIEQRLADVQPRLPSVTEARVLNEINREKAGIECAEAAEYWAQRREARHDASIAGDKDRELREAARNVRNDVRETVGVADEAIDRGGKTAGGLLGGIANMIGRLFDWLVPPPRLTPDQAERAERAADEQAKDRAQADEARAQDAARYDAIVDSARQKSRDEERSQRFHGLTRDPEDSTRDAERDRGRERDRD